MNALFWLSISTFVGLAVVERLFPRRPLASGLGWPVLGVVCLGLSFAVSGFGSWFWDDWIAKHALFDGRALGDAWGGLLGFLLLQLGMYAWHRAAHSVGPLWRLHQTHHSAERIDIFSAMLFHPLDLLGFVLATSLGLGVVVGLTASASFSAAAAATFFGLFQHANIRTPHWLGYIITRPESHALHHARGVHGYNYSDLPVLDMLFRTFKNPRQLPAEYGFGTERSRSVTALLLGRDVSQTTAPRSTEG